MPAGYCILITVSFQSMIHSAFLAFLTYKLYAKAPLAITYNACDVVPSAYPSAPIKEEPEYVL